MNNLTVKISEEEFLKKPVGEQNWILYESEVGHEERIVKLEKQSWMKSGLALLGGVIGGIGAKIGLG